MNNTRDDHDNPSPTVGEAFEQYRNTPVSGKYSIIPQEDAAFLTAVLSIAGMKHLTDFQNEANRRGGGFTSQLKERFKKFEAELTTLEVHACPASDVAFLLDVLAILDIKFARKFIAKSNAHSKMIQGLIEGMQKDDVSP